MPSRLPDHRNVVLADYYGNVLAGFYQYGTVSWHSFSSWLPRLFDTTQPWIIVSGDRYASEQYLPTAALVMPGRYTLLTSDWSPLRVKLTPAHARPRQVTPPREKYGELNLNHARERGKKGMPSGSELSWRRLQAAHIIEWKRPSCAGTGTLAASPGGISRFDSVQNMLLLRDDLHSAWAEYEFGVNPDDGYHITAFMAGHDSIAGRVLRLDHVPNLTTCALDDLLRDHFQQGLLKHVKGRGERPWDFDSGALDLSDAVVWGTEEGKERLEVELENRLHQHQLKQNGVCAGERRGPAMSVVPSPAVSCV